MMVLYLCVLVVLVALACRWRTVLMLSLVAVAANVTPHTKLAKR